MISAALRAYNKRREAAALKRGAVIADLYKGGMKEAEIAARVGVSLATVSEWVCRFRVSRSPLAGFNREATDARAAAIAARYAQGSSGRAVAAEFGVSRPTVVACLKRFGIEARRAIPPVKPIGPLVEALRSGMTVGAFARSEGITRQAINSRLLSIETTPSELRRGVLALSDEAAEVYVEAIDQDRMTHADALEIAEEYQPSRRAA